MTLFISTAGTFRAPLASGYYHILTGKETQSAGIYTVDGIEPPEYAQTALNEAGISLKRSRALTQELLENAQQVFCLTPAIADMLMTRYADKAEKILSLTAEGVDDPFGGPLSSYQKAAADVLAAIDRRFPYRVTPLQESHIKELAALEKSCFSSPWTENQLREELGNPSALFLVCEKGGKVAGYAGCQTVLDEGYIANVAVSSLYRRQGIGKFLLGHMRVQAQKRKLSFLTLEVRQSNQPAIALYEACGFARAGVRPKFYQAPEENALIMTLTLS